MIREQIAELMAEVPLSGDLKRDMATFLMHHGFAATAGHCAQVGAEAKRLATLFDADTSKAEIAGWFHDISAVIPSAKRADIGRAWGLDILPEEASFPMIAHQKLSVVIAKGGFGITDPAILSAIGCHTTLKAKASRLDKVVFVADKIAWDQPGQPPYLTNILTGVTVSLDEATRVYLRYLWDKRDTLQCVHPWFVAAYQEMSGRE